MFISSTGMTRINDFQKYVPVDSAIAQAYEEFKGPGPEGAIKHQFFFGQGWSNSRWNREVVSNLVTQVIDQQATFRIPGDCLPSEVIKICLQDHLKQAHASWQLDKPRVHASGEHYETAQESHDRARSQENARSEKLKVNQRKFKKHRERLDTVNELLKNPRLSTTDRAKWKFAKEVLIKLGTDGQSSKHTDSDLALVTYEPFYCRRIVGQILRELDEETIARKLRNVHSKGKQ
ncbi:hypothetical protein BT96DRAFT_1105768 [Gymnopus androsaceus JB14]|uniref:Uncharacterized protein n=1 Tax=Gymnopus androsaceus JB14 TaxID=1447944 RepID=A0A6A4HNJ1_9AGAR|nr:hypothetical protein BT96DRAFT_1105768 [Gymnopus androsaceus JB14]